MSEHAKKKLIAALLFISCIISGWLLFITPSGQTNHLQNFAQTDSLLRITLSDFNIPQKRVSTDSTRIDSNFSRKTFAISVAPDFSKMQFHSELANRLSPYHISLPAQVIFPDRDMHIYLSYHNNIIRTVKLATNKNLHIQRSMGSLIVAFKGRPSGELLQTMVSWGEPIPAAIILQPPFSVPDWWEDTRQKYTPLYVWLQSTNGENVFSENNSPDAYKFKSVKELLPGATLLSFVDTKQDKAALQKQLPFSYIDAHNAIIFNDEMNESEFNQSFRIFARQARSGAHPIAIIMGSSHTVRWTRDELNIFEKGGLFIIAPAKVNY